MLHYVLTNDDYRAFNHYAYDHAPGFAAVIARQRVIYTILFALITLIATLPLEPWWLFLPVTAAVALVIWLVWPRLIHGSIDGQLKRATGAGDLARTGPVWLRWDAERVYEDLQGLGSYVDWGRIERIGETPEHLFLMIGQVEAIIVPRRAGAGVAEVAAFARQQVSSRRPG